MGGYKKIQWSEYEIVCPFFVSKENGTYPFINCEGYKDNMNLVSRFRTIDEREKHVGTYCAYIYRYNRCPVYKLIYNEKYSDEVIHNGRETESHKHKP